MNDSNNSILILEVTATDAITLQRELTAAEDVAKKTALQDGRCGILVTQHDFTHFTVAVTPEVPFGETRERRERAAATTRQLDEWQLLVGAEVEVRLHDGTLRRGAVDDAMPDGSGFWLAADGMRAREFIEKASGFTVWVDSYLLLPALLERMRLQELRR